MTQNKTLTTASGVPVADNQNSLTAGPLGPIVLTDFHLIEKLAHFNRENIPERRVHAKGSGAYGTFTVTSDITRYTKADLFSAVGKETPTFLRFPLSAVSVVRQILRAIRVVLRCGSTLTREIGTLLVTIPRCSLSAIH